MSKKPQLTARIKTFDHLVRKKDFAEAQKVMGQILQSLELGEEGFGGSLVARGPLAEREATLMAAAVTSMLADESFKMTTLSFRQFTQFKRALMQVFEISGYRGTDHMLEVIGEPAEPGSFNLKGYEVPKLFAGLSINSLTPTLVQLLKRQAPEVSWPLVQGYLSEQLVWSSHAEAARAELLSWGDKWMDIKVDTNTVRNIGPSYMGCSYAEARHKHEIKKCMNHLSRRFLEGRGVKDADLPTPRRAVKKRPTVVVMAELYDSRHAMHRCYGPAIQSLQKKFKTIYMSPNGTCDPMIADIFDKVDATKFSSSEPQHFINKIMSYRPDIVYFPSIGMRLASILASNVRMAPIQVMTYGHPATTFSDQIDYAILVEGQLGSEDVINEKILYRPSKPRWHQRHDAEAIKPMIRENPPKVRIAVPAWSRKVTPGFLQACVEISKRARANGKQVEFVFFPNGAGALYQAFARRVEDMLPAKVMPRTDYNQYIKWLNSCDIFLSTFPFGATNGIIDAALQGIPVVNLKGDEVHAMNDSDIVAKYDQPDWLSADSVEDYINAVVRLTVDGALRKQVAEAILASKPEEKLMSSDDDGAEDFVTVMEAAYKFHEDIQASGQKSWSYESLKGMLQKAAAE